MTRRFLFFSLAAGLLTLSFGGLSAKAGTSLPTTLDNLVAGATFEVSDTGFDFLFSGFKYSATGSMPAAGAINVNPVTLAGSAGLQFTGAFGTPIGTSSDALITYTVTSLLGGPITDAHLDGNPAVLGGAGTMAVTDSLIDPATNNTLKQLSIFDIEPPPPGLKNNAEVFGLNNASLLVTKDIFAQSTTGVASLSVVDQTYSVIPEPTSVALLGIGLSGLLTFRRFFRRTSIA